MDVIALIDSLAAELAGLQLKLVDAQAAIAAEKKASYDLGFADGVASTGLPQPEKIFTQADLDAAASAAAGGAVAALKADLLAQYEAQQVVENDSETGFKNLLA